MDYKLTFDQYQKGLEQEKFLGLICNKCNAVTFPPMAVCRSCNGTDCDVTEIKGEGVLRTFTVIRVAPEGMKPPYVVAMVELDEGAWVIGNLVYINPDDADMSLMGRRVKLGSRIVKGDTYSPGDSRAITFTLLNAVSP
ncbi:MAG: Zn-ribbon domain-containing OB-fold protein [Desulfobacteraceae bacterium]|nr:MAG: Zn-ribbon domain-containing OB-fold protein [Desulfobacteraceae bacterium]